MFESHYWTVGPYMIGYLKLPYANPQERGQKEYHTSLYWFFFFIYWHHYFEYCRNVVLGRKNAKVHHYMLHYIVLNILCGVEKQMG
jgi:hypothetical protein